MVWVRVGIRVKVWAKVKVWVRIRLRGTILPPNGKITWGYFASRGKRAAAFFIAALLVFVRVKLNFLSF